MKRLILMALLLVTAQAWGSSLDANSDDATYRKIVDLTEGMKSTINGNGNADVAYKYIDKLWALNADLYKICDYQKGDRILYEANDRSAASASHNRIMVRESELGLEVARHSISELDKLKQMDILLREEDAKNTARLQANLDRAKAAVGKTPCIEYYDNSKKLISTMMFQSAEYYAKKKNKKAAKKVYREIVTTFIEYPAYKSEVKKAEYALEDLK